MNGNGSVIERETAIGAVVLIVGAAILALAYAGSVDKAMAGYDLKARFAKAEGISVGSEVRLAGVTVGRVVAQQLDPRYKALLTLRIAPDIQLPKDSAALIETDGLLGSKFIALQPGADEAALKPGAEFQLTQSSMNVNDILELIISQAQARRAQAKPSAPAAPEPGK